MKAKTKLSSALLLLFCLCLALASCGVRVNPDPDPVTPRGIGQASIYDPDSLKLSAGVPIQTKDGVFTPPVDTVFFSRRVLDRLNEQLLRGGR